MTASEWTLAIYEDLPVTLTLSVRETRRLHQAIDAAHRAQMTLTPEVARQFVELKGAVANAISDALPHHLADRHGGVYCGKCRRPWPCPDAPKE